MSSRALARNRQDGKPCEALYADPHPRLDIVDLLPGTRFVHDVFTPYD